MRKHRTDEDIKTEFIHFCKKADMIAPNLPPREKKAARPGLAATVSVLAFNLLGEGLKDYFQIRETDG